MSSQPIHRNQLANEFTLVLSSLDTDEFSPGELTAKLEEQNTWREYLRDRSIHEQVAIVGRFLAANGALPLKRDRQRGSLYANLRVRQQLAQDLQPQAFDRFLAVLHLVTRKA